MASARAPASPQPAYVLHSYDWSESSLIVELWLRQQGRVVTAAKGAKRPTSNFRAVLLPFQRIQVLLGRTPADATGEVHLLRSAEWAGGPAAAGGQALFAGFYVNELLLKLLPRQDPHPQLFDAYADTLHALSAVDERQNQAALRAFELALLRELGWLPELHLDTATQQPLRDDVAYALHAETGLVACGPPPTPDSMGAGLSGQAWRSLRQALAQTPDLAALRQAAAPHATALRPAVRDVLAYHLGQTILRTRRVRQSVQQLARAASTTIAAGPLNEPTHRP
jgi:DNA repair protein RecO (recombination protein O)